MKGPVEANMAVQEDDFSEYMWMGEENLDDFDKQIEEELTEEMRMNEALEAFEEQQAAALYAQENLTYPSYQPPSQRGGRGRGNHQQMGRGFYPANAMNNHMNGFGDPAVAGLSQHPMMHHSGTQHGDNAAIAATSSLNPNAPEFILNPNAPEFVPSWGTVAASGAASGAAAISAISLEDKNTTTNGSSETDNGASSSAPPSSQ